MIVIIIGLLLDLGGQHPKLPERTEWLHISGCPAGSFTKSFRLLRLLFLPQSRLNCYSSVWLTDCQSLLKGKEWTPTRAPAISLLVKLAATLNYYPATTENIGNPVQRRGFVEATWLKEFSNYPSLRCKGSHQIPIVQFFLTLFKQPLTPPPSRFEHVCCKFFNNFLINA